MATGVKINTAADDAANLFLSKKIQSKLLATDTLTNNAQSGIDLLSTADGDLDVMTQMLQRMRNLSVQGLNGVYSQNEKDVIMHEIDTLGQEIKRIALSSKYSDKSIFYNDVSDPIDILVSDTKTNNTISLSTVSNNMLFVDVLAKDANVYMLNMLPGQTYHVEFNNKLYQVTNSSAETRNLIYSYKEDLLDQNKSIQFIQDNQGVTTSFEGPYENTQVQMGSGERYQTVAGGQTNYFNVGNEVFSLANSSADAQTAVFTTAGSTITPVSGAGITATHQFTTSNPTNAFGNETALSFNGSEQKYINYLGNLYSLTNNSATAETFVFRNNAGALQALSGNITASLIAAPSTSTALNASNSYIELTANQEVFYDYAGTLYSLKNNTAQLQTLVLNNTNNIINPNASVTRTAVTTTNGAIGMANPYSINAIAGQTYYVKSADNSQLHELVAAATGKLLLDFDGNNINSVGGVGATLNTISTPDFEAVTPDGSNQFIIDLKANTQEAITIGSEVYKISNVGAPKNNQLFDYDPIGKTIAENVDDPQITVDGYMGNLAAKSALNANDYYLSALNTGQSTFMQIGGDTFKITNSSGSTTDAIMSYNAGAHSLSTGTGGITATLVPQASFTNNVVGDRSLNVNGGQTRFVQFGSDNFEIKNNTASAENAVFTYSGGNLTINDPTIASYFTITKHVADNAGMTALAAGDIYTTLGAGANKYFALGGDYYNTSNLSGARTVVFRDGGTTLNQIAGTGVNTSHIASITGVTTSTTNDYYIEMTASDQQYIKVGNYAYSLQNISPNTKTEVFRQFASSLISQNPTVTETNIPISNLGDFTQVLPIVDWAIGVVMDKRSHIGSAITALDQTKEMNSSHKISLSQANSTITDADIAQENANYVKTNILRNFCGTLLGQTKNLNSDIALKLLM